MQKLRLEHKFLVRQSTPSDYPTIQRLWKLAGLSTMVYGRTLNLALMRRTPDLFLVAEINGEIIGAVVAFEKLKIGHVHHLAVHPKYQRRGIGSKLLEEVCKRLSFGKSRFAFLVIEMRASERYGLIKFYHKGSVKSSGLFLV